MNQNRLVGRLQFSFALLTCLGGLVLASGTNNEVIPAIAIFFSIFGFLFVDWLRVFSLPPVAAYAAMGLASLYCISNFVDAEQHGNQQMLSVSQLLVCVQAILMLQKKTLRIYEQLAVFCLLELVVAAVFNDALNYGLLLIPICVIGLWGLTLLSIASSIDSVDGRFESLLSAPDGEPVQNRRESIEFSSPGSALSLSTASYRLPSVVMFSFAPAVFIVSAFFFYALPRTTDAGRINNRGSAVIGFNDEIRLEQLGQMGQNSEIAVRVSLKRRLSGDPYQPIAGIYLRGAVLERYRVEQTSRTSGDDQHSSSVWYAASGSSVAKPSSLPPEFYPSKYYSDTQDTAFSDVLTAEVTYVSSKSSALFSIAPYHEYQTDSEILHRSDRWTLARTGSRFHYPRIKYSFGTRAFRGGVQCETLIPGITLERLAILRDAEPDEDGDAEETLSRTIKRKRDEADADRRWAKYVKETLVYRRGSMPTIGRIADGIAESLGAQAENKFTLSKALEQHFTIADNYQYSLNLDADSIVGMDPIEQFVAVDRRGHCQYFASALAMMLRSQGIPARLVVGYKTEEYSELNDHYIARQSHAHAWVEALVDRGDLDVRRIIANQPQSDQYWLRLDPTPSSLIMDNVPSNANKVIDLAQDFWDGLIIDMDSEKQAKVVPGNEGSSALSQSYGQFVNRISSIVNMIRAGDLRGGALASRSRFSWQGASAGIGAALILVVLVRWKPPSWIRKKMSGNSIPDVPRPTVDFYADALDQLRRIGVERATDQTPKELVSESVVAVASPLQTLTSAFYRVRYRGDVLDSNQSSPSRSVVNEALNELRRSVDAVGHDGDTASSNQPKN